jgi:pimeloyl-ACP methyl ester carboxylesterase
MAQPEAQELGAIQKAIRSDGGSLGIVRRRGTNSDCTVFFVHGAGGRAGQFRHQIEYLATKVNVIAFDYLGHGISDKPDKPDLYNADNHLFDLIAVFERYKTKINHIVAHCYGSIHTFRFINWLYEQNRVKEVGKLVLISTSADAPATGGVFLKLPATILGQ